MPMHWRNLEEAVRKIASYKFGRPAQKDNIAGVDVDCLVKAEEDRYIVIEISKDRSLQKWREDLAKFTTIRNALTIKGIYVKCYFITEAEPTQGVVDGGRGVFVEVLSFESFEKAFFDYPAYAHLRLKKPFGSAVEPVSGNPDTIPFVPVEYRVRGRQQLISIGSVVERLKKGLNVVVLGAFGTGKSRLVSELFRKLSDDRDLGRYPLAINMRELWGVSRAAEIIRRHFDDLGLEKSAEPVIRMYSDGVLLLMLDGFDELGSQVWSTDPTNLYKIRYESLGAIRDLISKVTTGILVTGREHYFNTDDEMLSALGLSEDTLIIECPDEFSENAVKTYLGQLNVQTSYPKWLPRRPLICQIIANFDKEALSSLFDANSGGYTFWLNLISLISEREARINTALDKDTIKKVLLRLARYARTKPYRVGPFTPEDLNAAFKDVVKTDAVEASATMLQRLATLGRVDGNTLNRQFVDDFILNGLQAEDLLNALESHSSDVRDASWDHALGEQGLHILSDALFQEFEFPEVVKRLHAFAKFRNATLVGDIAGACLVSYHSDIDFGNLEVSGAVIELLDFEDRTTRNLAYVGGFVSVAKVRGAKLDNVYIRDTSIGVVEGAATGGALPAWIQAVGKTRVDAMSTTSRIKKTDMSNEQRVLVTIIKKTFFQPGSGRQEAALLRGVGNLVDPSVRNRILNILLSSGALEKVRGDSGMVYRPNRAMTARMGHILSELKQSKDNIWQDVTSLG